MQFRSICLWIMLLRANEVSSLSLSQRTAQQEAKGTTDASQAKNVLRMKPYDDHRPAFPDDQDRHVADLTYKDKKEKFQKKLTSTKESYQKRLDMKTETTGKNKDSMDSKWTAKTVKTSQRLGAIDNRLNTRNEAIDKHKAEKGYKTDEVYSVRKDDLPRRPKQTPAEYDDRKAEIESRRQDHATTRGNMTQEWKDKYEANWKEQREYVDSKRSAIDATRKENADGIETRANDMKADLVTTETTGMNARLRQKRNEFWARLEAHKENVNKKVSNLQGRKGSVGNYGPQYDEYDESDWRTLLGEPSYEEDEEAPWDNDSGAADLMSDAELEITG